MGIDINSAIYMASIIGGLVLGLNLFGIVYSRLIFIDIFPFKYIKNHNYSFSKFKSHLPLIFINLSIMCVLFPFGIVVVSEWIIVPFNNYWYIFPQLIGILLIDDFYFYWLHRLLHKNKYLYQKIHKIHHKASNPFPADYLYEHPLEWMAGLIGPFIAFIILGGVFFETIIIYLIIRVLHELDIHSGIKSSIYRYIPFAGINEFHAKHHKFHNVHFASVFSFWDIIFKTHSNSKINNKS